MGKRSGGGRHKSKSDGVIYTHPDCADAIMEVVVNKIIRDRRDFFPSYEDYLFVLDACCGDGILALSFKKQVVKHQPEVPIMINLVDIRRPEKFCAAMYKDRFRESNILDIDRNVHIEGHVVHGYDFIVCNPPFDEKSSTAIFNHLKTLLSKNGVLIFFNPFGWFCQSDSRCRTLGFRYIIPISTKMYMISGTGLLHACVGIYVNDDYEDKGFVPLPHMVKELLKDKEQNLLI